MKFATKINSNKSQHKKFSVRCRSNVDRLYFLTYKNAQNQEFYFFLLVDPSKEESFLHALEIKNQKFFLNNYGRIIKMGEGYPSEEMLEDMQENYDIIFQ